MRSAWLLFRLGSGATPIASRCCHNNDKKNKGNNKKTTILADTYIYFGNRIYEYY